MCLRLFAPAAGGGVRVVYLTSFYASGPPVVKFYPIILFGVSCQDNCFCFSPSFRVATLLITVVHVGELLVDVHPDLWYCFVVGRGHYKFPDLLKLVNRQTGLRLSTVWLQRG